MTRPQLLPLVVTSLALVAMASVVYITATAADEEDYRTALSYTWQGPGKNYETQFGFEQSEHTWEGPGKEYEDDDIYDPDPEAKQYHWSWEGAGKSYEDEHVITDPFTYSWDRNSEDNWQPPDELNTK
eukprot:CAMPEP_0117049144 /NCGR_PEP_ID=MMETSP0472-20121206/33963_1 /TAXON_ID=693140 ORGANISM="Tiarina fusus, Strain LIS" /NCGR_SAMPLE_ID=MMETSP0472 /ASSEMBLY_ACC=CAM_ASM_000603 /LENGTH=127 /DNA_ID=CAMNT_0004762497 /DNA_START=12 /DNA_END=395 /DNA_ORIENTATION=+